MSQEINAHIMQITMYHWRRPRMQVMDAFNQATHLRQADECTVTGAQMKNVRVLKTIQAPDTIPDI